MFLHGINDPRKREFYYANFDTDSTLVFYTCKEAPLGCLTVLFSEFLYIHHSFHEHIDYLSVDECLQAQNAYND